MYYFQNQKYGNLQELVTALISKYKTKETLEQPGYFFRKYYLTIFRHTKSKKKKNLICSLFLLFEIKHFENLFFLLSKINIIFQIK